MNNFIDTFFGKPNTIRIYKTAYKHWVEPYKNLSLADMYEIWVSKGLSPNTIRTNIAVYKKLREWEKNLDIYEIRKYTKLNFYTITKTNKKILSKEEIIKLSNSWDSLYPKYSGYILAAGHAGLRLGEVLGLQWKDIDFIKKSIMVERSFLLPFKKIGKTKNNQQRIVPLSNTLERSLLKRYNNSTNMEDFIFRMWHPEEKLRRACKKTNIDRINYHLLRHSFATLALEAGLDSIKTVSNALGHNHVSTTIDIYWSCVQKKLNLDFLE